VNWQTYIQNHVSDISPLFGEQEAASILQRVAEHISRMPFTQIREKIITQDNLLEADTFLKDLKKGKPIQYILGETWFYKYPFKVNASVLIPRPETEELIEWALSLIRNRKKANNSLHILDIGTGSGCIPITMKKERPQDIVTSVDISEKALDTARENAAMHNTDIKLHLIDFTDESKWILFDKYDIIISNPPYIPLHEKEKLSLHVRDYEPPSALFVPDENPLIFYEKIARFGKEHLKKDGDVFVELHQEMADKTKSLFEMYGYREVTIKKDISGNDRMLHTKK
jgi:release factor glutamine methyltransferase